MKNKTNTGFTIVELLIVIVVIGILAAISIVAYNGIQDRANHSKNVSAARSFVTAFKLLAQDETPPTGPFCLGDPSVYTSGSCSFNGSAGTVNAALNAKLASYGASSSTKLNPKWNNGHLTYHGNWFSKNRVLIYHVALNQDCGVGNVLSGDWNDLKLEGKSRTDTTATTSVCYISLD